MSPTVPSFRHLRLCLSGTAVPAAFALAVILVAARRPGNGRHRRADATARSRNNERPLPQAGSSERSRHNTNEPRFACCRPYRVASAPATRSSSCSPEPAYRGRWAP